MTEYAVIVLVLCLVGISAFFAICAVASCKNGKEQSMTDEMAEVAIKSALLPRRSKADAAWVAEQNARKVNK